MLLAPTLAPRAPTLWERQAGGANNGNGNTNSNGNGNGNGNGNSNGNGAATQATTTQDPVNSFISGLLGGSTNTDQIISSQSSSTPATTRTRATPTTTSTPSTTSTPTSTSSSSTISSTSSTPTSTSTSSSSAVVITTSSPTTVVSTSLSVSGTSTAQVVVTTVVTPVVTTTSSPDRTNLNRSSSNGGLIGGVVGGVIGGLALLAILIAVCVMASRRKSRTGHAYFLCFGERPSRAGKGELGHSGGAWPTFDPSNDYGGPGFAAGAAGAAAGAAGVAAASRNRRRRREQANATLPSAFANEDDPESYGYSNKPTPASQNAGFGYDNSYDAYNAYGSGAAYPEMQEHGGRGAAGALAAGAAAGGAGTYLYNNAGHSGSSYNRRSSAGHQSYGTAHDSYSNNLAGMSPNATASTETPPAPWTLPMMGWQDTHGPYSAAGVGQQQGAPQAQFMVSPSEANVAAAAAAAAAGTRSPRSPGPDYSHFDPPEVRDARAREAASAGLARRSFSTSNSHNRDYMPLSPRRQSRRLSSNRGSPISEHAALGGGMAPPAYVDAQDALEEIDEQPRRLHLTNAEPSVTDEESSRGGPSRRPAHNHKDPPPAATYRQH